MDMHTHVPMAQGHITFHAHVDCRETTLAVAATRVTWDRYWCLPPKRGGGGDSRAADPIGTSQHITSKQDVPPSVNSVNACFDTDSRGYAFSGEGRGCDCVRAAAAKRGCECDRKM